MALLIGSTSPSAATGADGDYFLYLDTAGNRYFQGPKANGAWPATYYSLQGPSGPAILSGAGAPASGFGAQGQGYIDLTTGNTYLKGSGGWATVLVGALVGPPGPVGTQGLALTNQQALTAGPQAGYSTATTTSANAVLPMPGTGVAQSYILPANAYFGGFSYLNPSNSGGAFTVNLYDQTAGSVLYTSNSIPTAAVSNVSLGSPIAITAGNTIVWRISAGSNLLGTVTPYFLMPATSTVGIGYWPTAALSTDTSFTATKTVLRASGATVANNGPAQYIYMPKASYLQSAQVTVTGSAQVTLYLQTGSSVVYTSATISAGNSPYTTPIYSSSAYPLAGNTQYLWYVSGTGVGQVYVNTSLVA